MLRNVNKDAEWSQRNWLLRLIQFMKRRLDRQHTLADRFAEVLFVLGAWSSLDCLMVHRYMVPVHLH